MLLGRRLVVAAVALGLALLFVFQIGPKSGPPGIGEAQAAKIADTAEPSSSKSKSPAEPGKSKKSKSKGKKN